VDRGKGGCQQAATHKVNKSTRAVGAAELAGGTAGFEDNSPDIPDCPAPSAAILCEKIGIVCHYVRDVGVAGSNPVTPTIDFRS
jgi:hypothetical protein